MAIDRRVPGSGGRVVLNSRDVSMPKLCRKGVGKRRGLEIQKKKKKGGKIQV